MAKDNRPPDRCWMGWAIDRPGKPLFVEYGCTEADAWMFALGWPDEEEIAWAKEHGARAFPVVITEDNRPCR